MTVATLPPSLAQPALFDRSDCGRIRLTGGDRARFLHNQTTNHIEQLTSGTGTSTVFVTSTGRTLDLATTYAFADALLVTVSPGMAPQLYDWMDRYIFFSDKVTLTDESTQTFQFVLLGAGADQAILVLGADTLTDKEDFTHTTLPLLLDGAEADLSEADLSEADITITIAVGSGLATSGYTIMGPKSQAAAVQQRLTAAGATVATPDQWEYLRVQQGRPAPGHELTDDDNPLEAGLWHSISFEKGCYIGQETIARLNTYKGVKKRLWGLKLSEPVEPGAAIFVEDNKVGKVTSVVSTEGDTIALGYIRTKAGGEALNIKIESTANSTDNLIEGETYALPFISHTYYQSTES